jgi:HlyD family secretion protein
MMLNDSNEAILPRATSEQFLPPISPWITLGGLLQIASVSMAIALAAIIKYDVTVRVSATVRPTGEVRIVQAAIEGTVENIKVTQNQVIKQGDAIAIIDDNLLQTQKSKLESNIAQRQLQLTQIEAQIRALNNQITAEKERNIRAINTAEAELSRSLRDYQDRQKNSSAEVEEAAANLRIAERELQKSRAELKSAEANLKSIEAALNAAKLKRDRYRPVAETGALSQNQLEEAQLAVEQQQQAVASQKGAIEAQKQTTERQQQAVEAATARLHRVQTALNPNNAEVAIAQQRIASEKASGSATLAILNREEEALIQQQIELNKQLAGDMQDLQQLKTDLEKTTIRATSDGTILKLELRNPGQVVRSGDAIAQIAPAGAPLIIKARVPAQEIGKVQVCQLENMENCQQGKAQLRVSAYPYPDYGTLPAAVRAIAPDTMTSGDSNFPAHYEVTIEAKKPYLVKGDRQYFIQPGMEITADIISKEETLLTFILRKIRLLTDL